MAYNDEQLAELSRKVAAARSPLGPAANLLQFGVRRDDVLAEFSRSSVRIIGELLDTLGVPAAEPSVDFP